MSAEDIIYSHSFKWINTISSTSTRLSIKIYDYNVASKQVNGTNFASQLLNGTNVWSSKVSVSTGTSSSANLTFAVMSETAWTQIYKLSTGYTGTAAITFLYDTSGKEIYNDTTAIGTSERISSAHIYFSPLEGDYAMFFGGTIPSQSSHYKAIVAHEVGHVLGFAHNKNKNSVLLSGQHTITTLGSYDLDNFYYKYGY